MLRVKKHTFFSVLGFVFIAVVVVTSLRVQQPVYAASPGDVVINEIMYNPPGSSEDDEFLELYNTTGSPIDLTGWCFSSGITLVTAYSNPGCFDTGTTIAANGYLVVSPNPSQTNSTYGVTAAASYAGTNLSNGGETITLVDDGSNEIDTVSYDDVSPWPTSPDGNGHSLELKNPISDNSVATNWGASIDSPTPGAQNSWVGVSLPTITNVTDPNDISASTPVNITADISDEDSVELTYKVNFGSDVTIPMYDDGAHHDGAASDGTYGAQIPGQAIKTLVRFKVTATNIDGSQTSPDLNDSMSYDGYYVADPSASYDSPILNLFISDADYTDLITNHTSDDVYVPVVVIFGNDVYDNARMKIRGSVDSTQKKPFKVKLPSGYEMDFTGGSNIATDEFELLDNEYDDSIINEALTWMTEQTGLPSIDRLPAAVQKNGDFLGLYVYADKYQAQWRQANGYNTGELYEVAGQVVSGANDLTHINQLKSDIYSLTDISTQAQKDYVLDNFDIPKTFNFMAAMSLVQGWDHFEGNNILQYFDDKTGRWSNLLWDQGSVYQLSPMLSFYSSRAPGLEECWTYCPVYNQKDLRALYFRRFRTLYDALYSTDALKSKFEEIFDKYKNDTALDDAAWPKNPGEGTNNSESNVLAGYENAKQVYGAYLKLPWGVPGPQTDSERQQVSIDAVNPSISDDQEYIRLSNAADTPVDLSNWVIEELGYTIPPGVVIPANGSIYFVKSDIGYKASHEPTLIGGQFDADLGVTGTLTLKTDANAEIDSYVY